MIKSNKSSIKVGKNWWKVGKLVKNAFSEHSWVQKISFKKLMEFTHLLFYCSKVIKRVNFIYFLSANS